MHRSTNDSQLLADDLRRFLRFTEDAAATQERPDAASASSPQQNRVGRSNPALTDLQHMRRQMSPLQSAAEDHVKMFYVHARVPRRNMDLGFTGPDGAPAQFDETHLETVQRRASFLLNSDALDALPEIAMEIAEEAGIIGHSTATLAFNAIAGSVGNSSNCWRRRSTRFSRKSGMGTVGSRQ